MGWGNPKHLSRVCISEPVALELVWSFFTNICTCFHCQMRLFFQTLARKSMNRSLYSWDQSGRKTQIIEENLHFSRCILNIENLPSKAERNYNYLDHTGSYTQPWQAVDELALETSRRFWQQKCAQCIKKMTCDIPISCIAVVLLSSPIGSAVWKWKVLLLWTTGPFINFVIRPIGCLKECVFNSFSSAECLVLN